MVYDFPEATKAKIAAEKRVERDGAGAALRRAGRRCVRLPERRAALLPRRRAAAPERRRSVTTVNIFPDQTGIPRLHGRAGRHHGRLLIPGSTAELGHVDGAPACSVTHPVPDDRGGGDLRRQGVVPRRVRRPAAVAYRRREGVLASPRPRRTGRAAGPHVPAPGAGRPLPHGRSATPSRSSSWATPTPRLGSPRADDLRVVIDFPEGVVRLGRDGERCRYRFRVARPLVERLLADGEVDWSNSLFLSMRFVAHRAGAYNEYVYTWFKCQALHAAGVRRGLVRRAGGQRRGDGPR